MRMLIGYVALAALIIATSAPSLRPLRPLIPQAPFDHALVYVAFAMIALWAWPGPWLRRVLLLLALAIALEFLHVLLPSRAFQWQDLAANIAGTLVGVGLVVLWQRAYLLWQGSA